MYLTQNKHLSFTANDIIKYLPYNFDHIKKTASTTKYTKVVHFKNYAIKYTYEIPNASSVPIGDKEDRYLKPLEFTAEDRTIIHYMIAQLQLQKQNPIISLNDIPKFFKFSQTNGYRKAKELVDRMPILSNMVLTIELADKRQSVKEFDGIDLEYNAWFQGKMFDITTEEVNAYHKYRTMEVNFTQDFKMVINYNKSKDLFKSRRSKVYIMRTLNGREQDISMLLQNEGQFNGKYRGVNLELLTRYGNSIETRKDRILTWNKAYKRLKELCKSCNISFPLYTKDRRSNMLIFKGMSKP